MNLSETAYITPTDEPDLFGLRWWTPGNEVALCGHATLASTAVLSAHPRYGSVESYRFQTLSGELTTKKIDRDDGSHVFELDFPATVPEVVDGALQDDAYTVKLKASLGSKFKCVKQVFRSKFDLIVEVELEDGDHLGDWDLVLDPLVRRESAKFDLAWWLNCRFTDRRAIWSVEVYASRPCCPSLVTLKDPCSILGSSLPSSE